MFKPKKILVPTDFSEYSDRALREAMDIAEKYHSQIYLLHVIDENVQQCAVDYCIPQEAVDNLEKQKFDRSKELLTEEVGRMHNKHSVEINYDVKMGAPTDVILKEQKDQNIDLIVMASHKKKGFKSHFLSHVADKVAEKANVEVLLVKE
jgi:universal stress protein A